MSPEDLARLHERAAPSRGWSPKSYADLLDLKETLIECMPAGFALARQILDEAEILMVAVDPDAQRKGHGTTLMNSLLKRLTNAGVATVFLEVEEGNHPARALYAKLGFAQTGRRKGYYRRADGTRADALLLSKTL